MVVIQSNISQVIQWLDALEARLRGVLKLILNDPRWRDLALQAADQALAANGCPDAVRTRILATFKILPAPQGNVVWTLGRVRGLIQQAMQVAQSLATRPDKSNAGKVTQEQYLFGFSGQKSEIVQQGESTVHRLRQVALMPSDEEDAILKAAEELVRAWVYDEKDLDESEHENPEEAVQAILGILGLRGVRDPESIRELWSGIVAGGRAAGFAGDSAMTEVQADAAARLAGMIGAWVEGGGATDEALERANPEGGNAAKSMLGLAAVDALASEDDDARLSAQAQWADWFWAVAAGWMAMIAVELPGIVKDHTGKLFKQMGPVRE